MNKKKTEKKYNPEITKDDLQALGRKTKHSRSDGGDDRKLKNRNINIDFSGEDLDVPGRDLSKETTKKTLKDEENQLYSQGSAENEDLERNSEH